MGNTKIEWAEKTWNPIRATRKSDGKQGHYCQKISPGCVNCYAESLNRWRGNGKPYLLRELPQLDLYLDEEELLAPLHWKKPAHIFPCSMTDLFADFVPDEWIEKMYAVMALADKHTFMVLTKRPERRRRWYETIGDGGEGMRSAMVEGMVQYIYSKLHPEDKDVDMWLAVHLPLKNVWEGTSICTQAEARKHIDAVRNTPASLRWLSLEPLLERVDISNYLWDSVVRFVITGGESGPKARPTNIGHIRDIGAQCRVADVPVFVKQLGRHPVVQTEEGVPLLGPLDLTDPKGGDMDEWPSDLRVREMPK